MSAVSSFTIDSNSRLELPSKENVSSLKNGDLYYKVTEIGRDEVNVFKRFAVVCTAQLISIFALSIFAFVVIKVAGLTLPAVLIVLGGVGLTIGAFAWAHRTFIKTSEVAICKKIVTLQNEHPGYNFQPCLAFVHSMLVKIRDQKEDFQWVSLVSAMELLLPVKQNFDTKTKSIIDNLKKLMHREDALVSYIRNLTKEDLETLKRSSMQSGHEIKPLNH